MFIIGHNEPREVGPAIAMALGYCVCEANLNMPIKEESLDH